MTQHSFRDLTIGKNFPKEVNAVIEIPKGSHNKYEYDEETDVFMLDRVLHSPLHYPADYGFVPETRAEDGDHLDVLVVGGDPTFPGCVTKVRPLGMLKMHDKNEKDYKVLCVQANNTRFDHIHNLDDMRAHNSHFLKEVSHFFEVYKELEGKKVDIEGWGELDETLEEIEKTYKVYKKQG